MCKLQKQYDFYRRNKSALLNDYRNLYLVISDSLEVRAFATIAEAYSYGSQKLGLGTFMIQKCSDTNDNVQSMSNLGLRKA